MTAAVGTDKVCLDCRIAKPLSEYHRHNATKDRHQVICKPCMSARNRIWKTRNPEKLAAYERNRPRKPAAVRRDEQLRREYGIDLARYDELVKQQRGLCAICQEAPMPVPGKEIALYVDHCHTTNKVRGLLCQNCNFAIGHMKDDVARLRAAIAYLEET